MLATYSSKVPTKLGPGAATLYVRDCAPRRLGTCMTLRRKGSIHCEVMGKTPAPTFSRNRSLSIETFTADGCHPTSTRISSADMSGKRVRIFPSTDDFWRKSNSNGPFLMKLTVYSCSAD